MKRATFALIASAFLIGSLALGAQEKEPEAPRLGTAGTQAQKAPAMSPEMKAMMEAYEKAGRPGPNHKVLQQMAGTWDATAKWWAGPGEPEVTRGVSVNKMILGGRYLQQSYEGTAMGKPFHGMGLMAFDNVAQAFTGIWIDDMSTGIMTSTGSLDPSGTTLTSVSTVNDPLAKGPKKGRDVIRFEGPDRHVMEMYDTGPDGKEMKVMEITYSRRKK